jgi:hypothetical protein
MPSGGGSAWATRGTFAYNPSGTPPGEEFSHYSQQKKRMHSRLNIPHDVPYLQEPDALKIQYD